MTILLLEPEKAHLDKCLGILSELPDNVEVIGTVYPEEAVSIIEEKDVSVLISEFDIGIMSAEELFTMLELSSPKTVLMLMTEVAEPDAVLKMYNRVMFYELILKPINFPEDLLDPVYRAINEYEKRQDATHDVKDHEISAKRYISDYDSLKKELNKRIKDYSFIYHIFSGMVEGNVTAAAAVNGFKEAEINHIRTFAQGLMEEYVRTFIFGDRSYDGYIERLSYLFDNTASGAKVIVENHANTALDDYKIKQLYFFAFLCSYLSKNMFAVYRINVTIDEKDDMYVFRASNDLKVSKIGGEYVYNENNKYVREMYHKITDVLLKSVFLRTMKGYEENPYFMLVMIGKDS